jgi:hypothetical protein
LLDWQHDYYLKWVTWNYRGGLLVIFPDEEGNTYLEEGMTIKAGEKIGYIYDKDKDESEKYAQENYFLKNYDGDIIIRKILKNHGDHGTRGERLFLVEDIKKKEEMESLHEKFAGAIANALISARTDAIAERLGLKERFYKHSEEEAKNSALESDS